METTNKKTNLDQSHLENGDESKKKKNKRKWLIAAIVGLLIVGVASFVMWRSGMIKGWMGVSEIVDQDPSDSLGYDDPRLIMAGLNPTNSGNPALNPEAWKEANEERINALKSGATVFEMDALCVLFPLASYEVGANSGLAEFAETFLLTNANGVILIEGYTCDLGSDMTNMALSKNRAMAAKQVLMGCGIPEEKIEVKWFGESKYKELGYASPEDHRRVNVSIK